MGHFEELVKKLHSESILTYYDMLKIYSKINGDIFTDNCIKYDTNYKMNAIYYCINSKKVSLIHYLMQSVDPKIPKKNNFSYRRICKTKHCVCLNHYKRYKAKYKAEYIRKKNNEKVKIIFNIQKIGNRDLVVNFDR